MIACDYLIKCMLFFLLINIEIVLFLVLSSGVRMRYCSAGVMPSFCKLLSRYKPEQNETPHFHRSKKK